MTIFLIIKLLVVVFFLISFLQRPSLICGIGLLAATTAVLLDTFLGTFGRDEMEAELGFFYYILSGGLFAGTAVWLWGILRPLTSTTGVPINRFASSTASAPSPNKSNKKSSTDRQMLYDEIRQRFGLNDILDLMFDMGIHENEITTINQPINELIINLMDKIEKDGQLGSLGLAVERILTPPPPEHLPRPEKISSSSPPAILRHYLLANFKQHQLEALATELNIDWETINSGAKKENVRNFLLYLQRRERISDLVIWLHAQTPH